MWFALSVYLAYTEDATSDDNTSSIARAIKTGFVSNPEGSLYSAATGVAIGLAIHVVIPRVFVRVKGVVRRSAGKQYKGGLTSPSTVWPWEFRESLTPEVMDDETLRAMLVRHWHSNPHPLQWPIGEADGNTENDEGR